MLEGGGRRDAAARGALDQAALEEVRLVDFFDRVRLLGDRDRERREADGAAAELLRDREQDVAVEPVERGRVDLEQLERAACDGAADAAVAVDLGVVADPSQEAVGDARRAAGAGGDGEGSVGLDRDAEDLGGTLDDRGEVLLRVQVEAVGDAEAVAQRRRQEAGSGGRSDQRELRQVERHHARARALPDGDRELAVLHRRIEGLLERAREPVDRVYEEDGARLERGQERRHVPLALEHRSGGLDERDVELGGDDLSQRGLAEAGRPREEHVVEGLAARAGGVDEHAQLILHGALADEVLEAPRPQRAVEILVGAEGTGGADPLDVRAADAAHQRAALSASAISSSGVSPAACSSSESISRASKPRPARPSRATATGSSLVLTEALWSAAGPATRSRSSTMIRSAVRLPIPGTAWNRALSPSAIARRSSRAVPPESTASATFGPTPWTPTSRWKSSRSSSVAKP